MPQTTLNKFIRDEIARLTKESAVNAAIFEEFAQFVIENHKKKDPKPLPISQVKKAIYEHFNVSTTPQLKKSSAFKMATDGISNLNFSDKEMWKTLYREFIGFLPGEEKQEGYGCINGINIFNYFKPWDVFALDSKSASQEDIKKAYRELSKIYHPDVPKTGDSRIFERINVMYRSITAEA